MKKQATLFTALSHHKVLSYAPIISIFSIAAIMMLALIHTNRVPLLPADIVLHFIAFSMVLLSVQKLQDLKAFAKQFTTYDLLAMIPAVKRRT